MYPLRRLAPMLLVVVALGTTPACDHAPARPEPDVTVELKDFEVGLSTARTESGRVVFDLENTGPTVHELVVARTDLPGDIYPVQVAHALGVEPGELSEAMLKQEQDNMALLLQRWQHFWA